jgi:hypothetical protein
MDEQEKECSTSLIKTWRLPQNIRRLENKRKTQLSASTVAFLSCRAKLVGAARWGSVERRGWRKGEGREGGVDFRKCLCWEIV